MVTEPAATDAPVGSSVAEASSTRVIAVLASSAARSCSEARGAFEIGIPAQPSLPGQVTGPFRSERIQPCVKRLASGR